MTLAVEPMIAMGDYHVSQLERRLDRRDRRWQQLYAPITSTLSPSTKKACRNCSLTRAMP